MSTSYLSFASIAKLHNNSLLTASTIGELSNKARTYAKDPGVFTIQAELQESVLYNFLSQKDSVDIVMPQGIAETQIRISNWLYEQAKLNNITGSRPNTLALLQATFNLEVEIEEVGEMATNNAIWLPSYVKGVHLIGDEKQTGNFDQVGDTTSTGTIHADVDVTSLTSLNYHVHPGIFPGPATTQIPVPMATKAG